MIKIAVMTWVFAGANYGQTLQAFALNKFLDKYSKFQVFFQNCVSTYAIFYKYLGQEPLKLSSKEVCLDGLNPNTDTKRMRVFDGFVRKYLNFLEGYSQQDMECDIITKNCEIVVFGGDQIWNPAYNDAYSGIFVSDFCDDFDFIKISYAPSVGINQCYEDKEDIFDYYCYNISKFNYISVRESDGKTLIYNNWKKNGIRRKNISCVLDPAFLLTSEEWWNAVKEEFNYLPDRNDHCLLCYFVGEYKQKLSTVLKIAEQNDLSVKIVEMDIPIEIHDDNIEVINGLNPLGLVFEIANADIVLGDSYHAAVFSIIFDKQFALFHRIDKAEWSYEYDSRGKSLFNVLGIPDRTIESYEEYKKLDRIDYNIVHDRLEKERIKSIKFLNSSLEDALFRLFYRDRMKEDWIPYRFPAELAWKKLKLIIYGAGHVGIDFYCQCKLFGYAKVVLWIDKEEKGFSLYTDLKEADQDYNRYDYDYIIITIKSRQTAEVIKQELLEHHADINKILWFEPIADPSTWDKPISN